MATRTCSGARPFPLVPDTLSVSLSGRRPPRRGRAGRAPPGRRPPASGGTARTTLEAAVVGLAQQRVEVVRVGRGVAAGRARTTTSPGRSAVTPAGTMTPVAPATARATRGAARAPSGADLDARARRVVRGEHARRARGPGVGLRAPRRARPPDPRRRRPPLRSSRGRAGSLRSTIDGLHADGARPAVEDQVDVVAEARRARARRSSARRRRSGWRSAPRCRRRRPAAARARAAGRARAGRRCRARPSRRRERRVARRRTSVSGPGQKRSASASAAGGISAAQAAEVARRRRGGRSPGGRPAGP